MKKTMRKTTLIFVAVVVVMLLVAVCLEVPAFAAEMATSVADSNPQIVYEEPDLGESNATDGYITLPDALAKDGYIFRGWRVNGGSDLYNAGDVVVKDGSEEMHLQPVYEADTSAKADNNSAGSTAEEPNLLDEYEDGSNIVLQYGHDNILTLPDAKEKEGYDFYGWSVNGSTDLYDSGVTIPIKAGEKVTLRPVYVSTKESDDFFIKCCVAGAIGLVILIMLRVAVDVTGSNAFCVLGILVGLAFIALLIVGLIEGHSIEQRALAEALQQLQCMAP